MGKKIQIESKGTKGKMQNPIQQIFDFPMRYSRKTKINKKEEVRKEEQPKGEF